MSEPVITDDAALYRVWGEAGLLLYIGISNSFGRRWNEHAKKQPWWREKRRLTVDEWFDSREDAERAEEAAIKTEKPKYNKRHVIPLKPPPKRRAPERKRPKVVYVDSALMEYATTRRGSCYGAGVPCLEQQLEMSIFGCAGFTAARPCLLVRKSPEQLRGMGIIVQPPGARRLITAAAADLRETG